MLGALWTLAIAMLIIVYVRPAFVIRGDGISMWVTQRPKALWSYNAHFGPSVRVFRGDDRIVVKVWRFSVMRWQG